MSFFQNMDGKMLKALGVVIVEGDRPMEVLTAGRRQRSCCPKQLNGGLAQKSRATPLLFQGYADCLEPHSNGKFERNMLQPTKHWVL